MIPSVRVLPLTAHVAAQPGDKTPPHDTQTNRQTQIQICALRLKTSGLRFTTQSIVRSVCARQRLDNECWR